PRARPVRWPGAASALAWPPSHRLGRHRPDVAELTGLLRLVPATLADLASLGGAKRAAGGAAPRTRLSRGPGQGVRVDARPTQFGIDCRPPFRARGDFLPPCRVLARCCD